jgi:cytochrome b6-f complex iron-sulfur subunit
MSTTTVLLIAIPTLVLLAALVLLASARRRDTDAAIGQLSHETVARDRGPLETVADEAAAPVTGREVERAAALERRGGGLAVREREVDRAPVPWVPPDAEALGVSRRQFLNRSTVGLMGVGIGAFSAASLGFLWFGSSGGFGGEIRVGSIDDIKTRITEGNGFAYYPEGRMWVTAYPSSALEKARAVYTPQELAGMEEGIVALYQKCPHLGCRVPQCETSQWFECPCHGSQYNQVGEKKGGPAPRGMDRFPMTVSGGQLTVDTGTVLQGPPIGTNTTGQEAEGPHCVTGGASH